jgi:hypothetical protein
MAEAVREKTLVRAHKEGRLVIPSTHYAPLLMHSPIFLVITLSEIHARELTPTTWNQSSTSFSY